MAKRTKNSVVLDRSDFDRVERAQRDMAADAVADGIVIPGGEVAQAAHDAYLMELKNELADATVALIEAETVVKMRREAVKMLGREYKDALSDGPEQLPLLDVADKPLADLIDDDRLLKRLEKSGIATVRQLGEFAETKGDFWKDGLGLSDAQEEVLQEAMRKHWADQ